MKINNFFKKITLYTIVAFVGISPIVLMCLLNNDNKINLTKSLSNDVMLLNANEATNYTNIHHNIYNPVVNHPNEINSKYFVKFTNTVKNGETKDWSINNLTNNKTKVFTNIDSVNYRLLPNKVNDKYMPYIKYNINASGSLNIWTNYAYKYQNSKTISGKQNMEIKEISSSKANLNSHVNKFVDGIYENNNLSSTGELSNEKRIDYPYHNVVQFDRQCLGNITYIESNGKQTIIEISNGINLPLNINEWLFNGSRYNGNVSSTFTGQYKYDNNDTKWKINNYKIVLNHNIYANLTISLQTANNLNYDISTSINKSSIIDKSPFLKSSTATYDYETKTLALTINGENLTKDISDYRLYVDNVPIYDFDINGNNNVINITVNDVNDLPNSFSFKLNYSNQTNQLNSVKINEINKPQQPEAGQNDQAQDPTMNYFLSSSNNDSGPLIKNDLNPAGYGDFSYQLNLNGINANFKNTNSLNLNFNKNHDSNITNHIYSSAQLPNYGSASSKVNQSTDNVEVWYPKINPLYDYLIKAICNDHTFDFDNQEMQDLIINGKKANINNTLFASNQQKIKYLEDHYNQVLRSLFDDYNYQYKIKKSDNSNIRVNPSQIYIYEPINWEINVEINSDSCYLIFRYHDFDDSIKTIKYPFKTKLFLSNPENQNDKSQWNKNYDLYIKPIDQVIDVKNDRILAYADQFYDLEHNNLGVKNLLNSILTYRNDASISYEQYEIITPVTNNDNQIKVYNNIIQTRFTKDEFWYQLSQLNWINSNNIKNRSIYFDTVDQNQNQLNSWVDLAKGNLKFHINIGKDLKNFFLLDYQTNKKQQYYYQMTGFQTQYDIYTLKPINSQAQIMLNGFDNFDPEINNFFDQKYENKLKAANWVINNLFLYDNQSANVNNSRIQLNQTNNKILATNLDKDSFIQIVLKNDLINNIYFDKDSYDKVNGSVDVIINLIDLGDLPSKNKPLELISSDNHQVYKLNNNQQKQFRFKLHGFKKNYDLQTNHNLEIDSTIVGLNNMYPQQAFDNIAQSQNQIELNHNYVKNISWTDAYGTNNNPLLNNNDKKIIKTRLNEFDYLKLTDPILKNIEDVHKLNNFAGILNLSLIFNNYENAMNYNNVLASDNFAKLSSNIIDFKVNNLNRKILFTINKKYFHETVGSIDQFEISELNKYTPSEVKNILLSSQYLTKFFKINILNKEDINIADQNKIDQLFYINAHSISDLNDAIINKLISFENFVINNQLGTLQFDIVFKNFNGIIDYYDVENHNLNNFEINQQQSFKKTIKLVNLSHNSGIDFNEITPISIHEINQSFKTSFITIDDLNDEWILKNLIIYNNDQYKEYIKASIPFILDIRQFNLTYNDLINYLQKNKITRNLKNNATTLNGTINFDIATNNVNNVNFVINGFEGIPNFNWLIGFHSIQNINDYLSNNQKISIDEFNQDFILDNMIKFINQSNNNNNYILDNGYITKDTFIKQVDFVAKINKIDENTLNVQILVNLKNVPKKYSSINFTINGFENNVNNWWLNNMWYIIGSIISVIVIAIIIISVTLLIRKNKLKNKKGK